MTLARSLRILLALALLSAQQAALSHQIWHFGDHGSQPAQEQLVRPARGARHGRWRPGLRRLSLFAGEAPADFAYLSVALPAAATPGLAPSSRGPPDSSLK